MDRRFAVDVPVWQSENREEQAIWIVDAHCDTLQLVRRGTIDFFVGHNQSHLDLPRLTAGGVKVQFFAAFIHPDERTKGVARALDLVDAFFSLAGSCD
ncbi:MAG: membrane dipeptidase, partial [Bacillota bacterium]|nr:membrane dipeptidase [Bacillota bacterium]